MFGVDNNLPSMELCAECHDVQTETGCIYCHPYPGEARIYPRITKYHPSFNHKAHIHNDVGCDICHSEIAKQTQVSAAELPSMADCFFCHVNWDCEKCHLKGENLLPASHESDWKRIHGGEARLRQEDCRLCHSDEYCQECHQGDNLGRKTHPLNWKYNHGVYLTSQEEECFICHEDNSYCVDCHTQMNRKPRSHRAGWLENHGESASYNMESCLSCHDDAAGTPVCQDCH